MRLLVMKKLIYLVLLFLTFLNAKAQHNPNVEDLNALFAAIQKTPSYKKLLKGNKAYQQLYEDVKLNIAKAGDLEAFRQLSRLVSAINDNHLGFFRTPDTALKMSYSLMGQDKPGDIMKRVSPKSESDLEGIYFANNRPFGLYAKGDKTYQIMSLVNGFIIAEIFQTPYNGYDMLLYGNLQLIKNARLVNGTLLGTPFTKSREKKFSILDKSNDNFEYKSLNDNVGYLRLSSFSSSNINIKKSEEFFATMADKLTTANLIVDLRGNTGGGYKTSGKFLTLLKKYKGQIFILQNSATVSNAEQFILELKPLKNVTTLGEQTKGMITFGSNYGTKIVLPSGRFTFYPTDMKGLERDLAYESKGINPDLALDLFKSDWIAQTLEYIKNKP